MCRKILSKRIFSLQIIHRYFFDFAYMGKPVFYYQFDSEEYRAGHYQEGYFSYEKDGFGPVLRTEKDLCSKLLSCLEQNGRAEALYAQRIQKFFEIRG